MSEANLSILEATPDGAVAAGVRRLRAFLRFFRDPKAGFAGVILAFFIIVAAFAPLIAPYGEFDQNPVDRFLGPSLEHPVGTDRLGRDVFSRMIYGSRVSLRIGLIAAAVGTLVGVPLGLIAGFGGRWADEIIMRVVDAMIAFPNLIFLLFVVSVLGPGVTNIMIALGLNAFPVYARLMRAQTLTLKERDFVEAARCVGATDAMILRRHILPNAIQPIIVQASLFVGAAVLAESALTFLGIGIQPPTATWGVIIADGFPVIRINPWMAILPGFAIVAFVLSVNLLGDRLRDVLDPRLRGSR